MVVREMAIKTANGISHETHRNVLVDVVEMDASIRDQGFAIRVTDSFGDESLPSGFLVFEASALRG